MHRARARAAVRPSNLLTQHESRPEMRLIYQLAEGTHMAGYKMYKSIPILSKIIFTKNPQILKNYFTKNPISQNDYLVQIQYQMYKLECCKTQQIINNILIYYRIIAILEFLTKSQSTNLFLTKALHSS